eukprot:TRINITY_DN4564_c0_g1_i5.p1 TRINITY_DN4564_c0_g1~~TRINITY_DN4564_c0_g1_i5.p1  ORF type:complete len:283 (-),score=55.18 TRINITY_DN4564_c0_g1_i5:155-1003(-)
MGGESVARPSSRAKKAPATPTAPTANAKKKPTADATKRKGGKGDELENERIDCTTPENPSAEATGLSGEVIAPAETVVIDQDLADANRADFVLRDLTAEHIVQLEAINTPTREAICAFVTSTFSLHDAEVDLLKSILKDYYTNIIMYDLNYYYHLSSYFYMWRNNIRSIICFLGTMIDCYIITIDNEFLPMITFRMQSDYPSLFYIVLFYLLFRAKSMKCPFNVRFAKEKKWNGPQTAAFFSIMKAVLERSAGRFSLAHSKSVTMIIYNLSWRKRKKRRFNR